MKFCPLALVAVLASASAAKFNLRRCTKCPPDDDSSMTFTQEAPSPSDHSDGRVVINGLLHEASTEDLDVISDSIVTAYNKVFAHTGLSLEFFHPKAAAMVQNVARCTKCPPDDDTLEKATVITARIGTVGRCTKCPPDDDAATLMTSALQSEFEMNFCESLQTSGSANLANANGCSMSFLTTKIGETNEAQVTVQGTLGNEMSSNDWAVFQESLTAAYKDAFTVTDSTHFSVDKIATVDGPLGRCTKCPPDDDVMEAGVIAVVNQVGRCTKCPPDDDVMMTKEGDVHAAFEKSFCGKLASSGRANFVNVHDCAIRYVTNNSNNANGKTSEIEV